MNFLGLTAALATFLGVWLGHVAVRKIEAIAEQLWIPISAAIVLGLAAEYWSLITEHRLLSTAAGILGITLLWDALEFVRQQKRIVKGHAPANPANPRHARILTENATATTLDLLDCDPVGRRVSAEEAAELVS